MPEIQTQQGSSPLKPRLERFCQIHALAKGGVTQIQAYCQSADPPVEPTPGRQVSASRLASRNDVKDRIAWLRKQQADARAAHSEPVTRESIHRLLDEVTAALIEASKAAAEAGADGIAQQLHKVLVVHAGRSQRANARAPVKKVERQDFDSETTLESFYFCSCDA